MANSVNIGDRVRFLNAVGGGIVARKDGRTVYVEDEDGFEIPVLISDVVVVDEEDDRRQGSAYSRAPQKKSTPKVMAPGTSWRERIKADQEEEDEEEDDEPVLKPMPKRDDKKAEGSSEPKAERYAYDADATDDADPHFYVALTHAGQTGSLDMHVVNDSNYFASYAILRVGSNGDANLMSAGTIEPNTKEKIDTLNPMQADGQTWRVQLLMFKKIRTYKPQPVRDVELKPKGVKMLRDGSFVDNDFFDEKAYLMPVIKDELMQKIEKLPEADFHKAAKEGRKPEPARLSKSSKETGKIEVDLHAEALLPDTRGLEPGDIHEVQMNHVRTVMETHAQRKGMKIIFIHGVGSGKLKSEIRKLIERKYPKSSYQDASFQEYGFGATLVIV